MSFNQHEFQDRGMLKWGGFLLSEHSARNERESEIRNRFYPPKTLMDEESINMIIQEAVLHKQSVAIQKKSIDINGLHAPDIEGKITGGEDGTLYVGSHTVEYDEIRNIEVIHYKKWSDLSDL